MPPSRYQDTFGSISVSNNLACPEVVAFWIRSLEITFAVVVTLYLLQKQSCLCFVEAYDHDVPRGYTNIFEHLDKMVDQISVAIVLKGGAIIFDTGNSMWVVDEEDVL